VDDEDAHLAGALQVGPSGDADRARGRGRRARGVKLDGHHLPPTRGESGAAGRARRATAPPPGGESTRTPPPAAHSNRNADTRPTPRWRGLGEKTGSANGRRRDAGATPGPASAIVNSTNRPGRARPTSRAHSEAVNPAARPVTRTR